jgi:UPF0288 family protein (methanogenesis marker protein 3)
MSDLFDIRTEFRYEDDPHGAACQEIARLRADHDTDAAQIITQSERAVRAEARVREQGFVIGHLRTVEKERDHFLMIESVAVRRANELSDRVTELETMLHHAVRIVKKRAFRVATDEPAISEALLANLYIDIAAVINTDESETAKIEVELLRETIAELEAKITQSRVLLGEGVHTMFRKGIDAPGAWKIWVLIRDLPNDKWYAGIDWLWAGLGFTKTGGEDET